MSLDADAIVQDVISEYGEPVEDSTIATARFMTGKYAQVLGGIISCRELQRWYCSRTDALQEMVENNPDMPEAAIWKECLVVMHKVYQHCEVHLTANNH